MFGPFGKKDAARAPAPIGPRIPTDRVVELSARGYSEPEIIKSLKDGGYTPLEVDRAMKEALRAGTGQRSTMPQPPSPPPRFPRQEPPVSQRETFREPPPFPDERPEPAPAPRQEPDFGRSEMREPQSPWEAEEDMDDFNEEPYLSKPKPFHENLMERFDEDLPLPPPVDRDRDREPIPFQESPLPKGRDDRMKELKDRRIRETEELAEQIVDEKWRGMDSRQKRLEEKIENMAASARSAPGQPGSAPGIKSEEVEAMRREIESQKHAIEDTNARIDSLEEVVKGSLTPMMESLKKFSSAVRNVKGQQQQ